MKRLAALVLILSLFTAPTLALADFHGPSDVVETSSEQEAASVEKETLEASDGQADDGFDLWTREEYTIG